MRTGLRWVACLSCAGLMASLAWGDEGKPVTGVRPWKVSLSLRADYTDNRDSEPDSIKEETFDLYVKPRADWFVNTDRTLFDLFYSPSWRYRTDPSPSQNEDEFWHEAGLSVEHSCTPVLSVFLRHRLDYTDDPSIDSNGEVVRQDLSYLLNRTEAGVMYDLSKAWSADLTGRYRAKSYQKSEIADNNNETRADAEGQLVRHMSPTLDVYGMARYSDFGYDSSVGLERDFSSVVVALGCEKALTPSMRTGLAVGWQGQDAQDDSVDSKDIPYVHAWVRCHTVPAVRFSGEVSHAMRDSDVYPFASQEYTEVRAGCEYDVTPSIMIGLSGMYRYSDYEGSSPASAPDAAFETGKRSGTEDRYATDLGLTYKISPLMKLSLVQSYEDRDSDVAANFTKNTTKVIFGHEF